MTLPNAFNAIHILPIWEPGVVSSLYGPSSWNINPEFFSPILQSYFPGLDTVEKQLKVVINILHLMEKSVGMDVVPHTDRYSEMVLANPAFFEWLQRDELRILQQGNGLYRTVERIIYTHLLNNSPGQSLPEQETFFTNFLKTNALTSCLGKNMRLRRTTLPP